MTKRALLIGLNYFGQRDRLHGCNNDVNIVRHLLRSRLRIKNENIKVLTDDTYPNLNRKTIREYVKKLTASVESGDIIFFHFYIKYCTSNTITRISTC